MGLLALVLISVLNLLEGDQLDRQRPKAQEGVIDLMSIDFNRVSSVPLNGTWSFYWDQLLTHEQISSDSETVGTPKESYAKVPHIWLDMETDNGQERQFGFATYKLSVKLADASQALALKIPTIGTAFNLFINDQLITEVGTVGQSQASSKAAYKPGIYSFAPPAQTFDIILQVSNHDLIWGGIWSDLRLGSPEKLHIEQLRKSFKSTFIIAIFITIAVFNLIQYSLRTQDKTPLVICVTCLLLALREVETAQIFAFMEAFYIPFELSLRVSFLSYFLTQGFIIAYYYFSFKEDYNQKVMYSIFALSAVYGLITLLAPLSFSSALVPSFQLLSLLIIIYTSYGLVIAVKKKRPTANFIFLGTLVFFSLIVHDILINLRVFDGVQLVSLGLVALIMCQNYATYSQFMIASDQNKHLSDELGLKNDELLVFSKSLEDQVASRTAELSQANEQLEVFAFNDSLTNTLNRRGLLQRATEAIKEFNAKSTPFCMLLIDFDHFKKLNDTHGHEMGDKVLAEGANKMRSVVESQGYIGRWGGEEFLVLLNQQSIEAAQDVAEGIRVTIEELVSSKVGMPVTVSIGVSQYTNNEPIEKTINRADAALYEAKSAGRNRVVITKQSLSTSELSSQI